MWTPLVTWPIGISATGRPGQSAVHISLATSPWRRLTPLAARLSRSATWVMPNGSPALSGSVRPSATSSSAGTGPAVDEAGERTRHLSGRI